MNIRRDDRDLGLNLDQDPEPEVTIYDDRLAAAALVGIGLLVAKRADLI